MNVLQASVTLNDPAAARALRQNVAFLGLFTEPRSPSEIAEAAGMAPNLAHHHARKLVALGLLHEQRREGGRVYYQLTAREFRVPSDLLPPSEDAGNGSETVHQLGAAFLRAYERSWGRMRAGEEDVVGFGTPDRPASVVPTPAPGLTDEPYPTHSDILTLSLSPERYRRLANDLTRLLTEAAQEGIQKGPKCTFAVLSFQGEVGSAVKAQGISRNTDSFLL